MKTFIATATCAGLLCLKLSGWAATLYVDLNSPNPTVPYTDWSTAATNIQDAIDAAAAGDLVLVTNGVYVAGGKVMFGDLTNRVALDKAITVQSVNGPWVTTIKGNGATNGTSAVRCAWITNGATLQGFTVTAGATRTSGDTTNLLCGGAALCLNTNALLKNCLVISNVAQSIGGGVFQGVVANSAIIGNRCSSPGSGAAYAALANCTVVSNWSSAATSQCRHTNSIVYYNQSGNNYSGGTFAFSCTLPGGSGNLASAPQLLPDAIHLATTSPCRGAGTNITVGSDIDGQAWANPPSIGCDEWREPPLIVTQPQIQLTNNPIGFKIPIVVAGQEPFTCYWTRNGFPVEDDGRYSFSHSTNLLAAGIVESDAGNYYQVVVSNSFGMATSVVAQLVFHYVNADNISPVSPYGTWSSAATNIQDAINVAIAGEVVLVTNGVYKLGGKVMGGDLTNRVALDKAIIVQSVNGAEATIIEGNWNPTVTNGPAAIRCAWLTNGAGLSGFTLRGGATRPTTAPAFNDMYGGGVWASSTNAAVSSCLIATNTSAYDGGGAYKVSLINCSLIGNRAVALGIRGGFPGGEGGGAASCYLKNCVIRGNYAEQGRGGGAINCRLINCVIVENSSYTDGGAAYGGSLLNCTVTRNTSSGYSPAYGSAVNTALMTNCLVWGNFSRTSNPNTNYANSTLTYCLSSPLAAGVGNIQVDPQLLSDGVHVTELSPCRAAGTNIVIATDIDGQAWANLPSIGCDEWQPYPLVVTQPTFQISVVSRSLSFSAVAAGKTPFSYFWLKDGNMVQDDSHHTNSASANMKVLKFAPEDAGAYQVIISNAFGGVTSQVAQVVIHCVDALGTSPSPPYSNWVTAATNIQDAIDAAQAGDVVLVTNGVYSTGGKIVAGDLLNRVAIDKPITVMSVNGYRATVIEGARDPVSTNGNMAVRGVWMADGATLGGFTIRKGATRSAGNSLTLQSGGGIWAASTNATIANCLVISNSASYLGGGAYYAALKNSILTGNIAVSLGGGGAANASLFNCTVVDNYRGSFAQGGGTRDSYVRNSIVVNNRESSIFFTLDDHYETQIPLAYSYSCSSSGPLGYGNIFTSPTFVDSEFHLPAVSPCRGVGSPLFVFGEDMDGEEWANPPSMGADEVIDANLVGPISLAVNSWQTNSLVGQFRFLSFWDSITGRVSRIDWDFGDGVVITNAAYSAFHAWTNPGNFTVTSKAYNSDNPTGVSASIGVQISPLNSPILQSPKISSNAFKFSFDAQATARYDVQYATNLTTPVTWKALQTIFSSPGGTTTISDPAWTNSARFYRVLVQ